MLLFKAGLGCLPTALIMTSTMTASSSCGRDGVSTRTAFRASDSHGHLTHPSSLDPDLPHRLPPCICPAIHSTYPPIHPTTCPSLYPPMHPLTHSSTHPPIIYTPIHPTACSSLRPPMHPLTHYSLTHPLVYSHIQLPTHTYIYPFPVMQPCNHPPTLIHPSTYPSTD